MMVVVVVVVVMVVVVVVVVVVQQQVLLLLMTLDGGSVSSDGPSPRPPPHHLLSPASLSGLTMYAVTHWHVTPRLSLVPLKPSRPGSRRRPSDTTDRASCRREGVGARMQVQGTRLQT